MIYATTTKDIISVPPQARINNLAVTCTAVDRKGFDYAVAKLFIGANDIGLTVAKLQESDDDSTWTDIPGADFSIAGELPGSSAVNETWLWDVDLRGRKRYLRPALTVGSGGSGAYVTVVFELSRAEQMPHTAAERGAAQMLEV
ncbi:MAG TPA: hypothetical protein VHY37_03375 [Tepidisphaeraceae bacterium]|jgi:hypothetical protein|nr:hypothetical protein [Tepidisphaeraceae bacterium]